MPTLPPAVVLCGGRGLRAWPLTQTLPKPLLPVAGVPLLAHLLDILLEQGCAGVVLAAGHLRECVEEFAAGLPRPRRELVEVVDTGVDTGTAERLRRCAPAAGGRLLATYGDGLGDVDLHALLRTHARGGRPATVTAAPLRCAYGTLEIDAGESVTAFREKPVLPDVWVNAGFLVLEPEALDADPGGDLERDVLPVLAARGQLGVHRHRGFWRSADTAKDLQELTDLVERAPGGVPPWRAVPEQREVA